MKKKKSSKIEKRELWRQESITNYAYLVKHIASRFAMRLPNTVFFDELISAGSLGLIDAVDKFDPSKHVSLKTYAQYRIKGAILDELRNMDTYSRSMRKKIQDIARATKSIEDEKGAQADEEEIDGDRAGRERVGKHCHAPHRPLRFLIPPRSRCAGHAASLKL